MSPYQILNLSPDASDAEIREAYLRLVRLYPPTRFPDRFSLIANAYAQIDTPEKQLDYKLLGSSDFSLNKALVGEALEIIRFQRKRPDWQQFREWMQK